MNGRYLLDTNVIIDLFAGEQAVITALQQAEKVFIAGIVLGELYYGASRSQHVQANQARIDEFAAVNAVLNCDIGTAYRYAESKNRLREKGRPIPENDIWIAAIALQYDLTLATRDDHFVHVDGLAIERWVKE
jgi:tRNA(fMet)-specific endonuclease VapC